MRTRRSRPAPVPRSTFAGFRFPADVIVLAVRWSLRFGRSYRDVEELLAERGIEVDHVTVYLKGAEMVHAARRYSCRGPPSRSRRRTLPRRSSPATITSMGCSGARSPSSSSALLHLL
jgi:hypothetical protein